MRCPPERQIYTAKTTIAKRSYDMSSFLFFKTFFFYPLKDHRETWRNSFRFNTPHFTSSYVTLECLVVLLNAMQDPILVLSLLSALVVCVQQQTCFYVEYHSRDANAEACLPGFACRISSHPKQNASIFPIIHKKV